MLRPPDPTPSRTTQAGTPKTSKDIPRAIPGPAQDAAQKTVFLTDCTLVELGSMVWHGWQQHLARQSLWSSAAHRRCAGLGMPVYGKLQSRGQNHSAALSKWVLNSRVLHLRGLAARSSPLLRIRCGSHALRSRSGVGPQQSERLAVVSVVMVLGLKNPQQAPTGGHVSLSKILGPPS